MLTADGRIGGYNIAALVSQQSGTAAAPCASAALFLKSFLLMVSTPCRRQNETITEIYFVPRLITEGTGIVGLLAYIINVPL